MAVLGLLSIIQVVFLPGYLVVRAIGIEVRLLRMLLLSFASSLIVNHFLIVGLVFLGIYRPVPMYAIFCVEAALLFCRRNVWLHFSVAASLEDARKRWRNSGRSKPDGHTVGRSPYRAICLCAALVVIGGFVIDSARRFGDVFIEWDAVVSWNCWAIEWAGNHLPRFTGMYPQLLPSNLSITYVFMQSSEIWFFAKGILFLFCLFILVAMIDLAEETRSFGYIPGIVICYLLFIALLRYRFISSGYADVPLAMFSFACLYALILARHAKRSTDRWKYLIVGAVFCSGAALTKQIGLYWTIIYPFLAWKLVIRSPLDIDSTERASTNSESSSWIVPATPVLLTLLILMLELPWYGYKQIDFLRGRDSSNTEALMTTFHGARTPLERIEHGTEQLNDALLPVGAVFLLLLLAGALHDPVQRWILLVGVFPLAAIWMFCFSYDLRNLALAIPLAGVAAGHGMVVFCEYLGRLTNRLGIATVYRRFLASGKSSPEVTHRKTVRSDAQLPRALRVITVGHVALAIFALALISSALIPRDKLFAFQRERQKSIAASDLNRQLYSYRGSHAMNGAIATDYLAMQWLPDFQTKYLACDGRNLSGFKRAVERSDVEFVVLRTDLICPQVSDYLDTPGSPGSSSLVAKSRSYRIYRKNLR